MWGLMRCVMPPAERSVRKMVGGVNKLEASRDFQKFCLLCVRASNESKVFGRESCVFPVAAFHTQFYVSSCSKARSCRNSIWFQSWHRSP